MTMMTDAELLSRYSRDNDHQAFAEVVNRHLGFVYATALRQLNGDAHLARDAAQLVFIDLARKSRTVAKHAVLMGWLHTSTRYAAANLIRGEQRRRKREMTAQIMETTDPADPVEWTQIEPELDAVLGRLNRCERDAVLLRFFEKLSFAEVGARLGLSETAARSRVDRALDKMQRYFGRAGITSTAAALSTVLGAHPGICIPAGLGGIVTSGALASGSVTSVATGIVALKAAIGLAGTGLVCAVGFGFREVQVHQILREQVEQRAVATEPARPEVVTNEGRPARTERVGTLSLASVPAETDGVAADLQELRRLSERAATLMRRPPGVTDADLKWPQNVGRDTPQAVTETFNHHVFTHNTAMAATFLHFNDDTPENRAKFMAQFSEAIQRRYPSPGQISIAGNFMSGEEIERSPDDAVFMYQVVPSAMPGQIDCRTWIRHNGGEFGISAGRMIWTNEGWKLPLGMKDQGWIDYLKTRLDPVTGDYIGPRARAKKP